MLQLIKMKKLFLYIFLGLLLVSCDQINNDEKYMLNCVKDHLAKWGETEGGESEALQNCVDVEKRMPKKFKYYKGFMWTQPSQL